MAEPKERARRVDVLPVGPGAGGLRPTNWNPWIALGVAGLALRVVIVLMRGSTIYPIDHEAFVRWGAQATDRGVLTVYDEPPPVMNTRLEIGGRWEIRQRPPDEKSTCNYPPLAVYLFWISGGLFKALLPGRLINTPWSLLTFGIWSFLADVAVAAGCAAIVRLWRSERAALWTFVLVLAAPPLWWDSAVWAQVDSLLIAPLVWMLYAMLRGRWIAAGVLWGVALALKPQAILAVPVWALAGVMVLMAREGPGVMPRWQQAGRLVAGVLAAAAVVLVLALPFTVHGARTAASAAEPEGRDGAWTWFDRSYVQNIAPDMASAEARSLGVPAARTTMKAFNIWYLDLLVTDTLKAEEPLLGLPRAAWGRGLLAAALAAGFAYIAWRWWRRPEALLLWTAFVMLVAVMVPTAVHERYILLALPFVGVTAALSWRVWPGFVMLMVVSLAQMSWPLWQSTSPGGRRDEEARRRAHYVEEARATGVPEALASAEEAVQAEMADFYRRRGATAGREWGLTVLALLGTALTITTWVALQPPRAAPEGGRGALPPAAGPAP